MQLCCPIRCSEVPRISYFLTCASETSFDGVDAGLHAVGMMPFLMTPFLMMPLPRMPRALFGIRHIRAGYEKNTKNGYGEDRGVPHLQHCGTHETR